MEPLFGGPAGELVKIKGGEKAAFTGQHLHTELVAVVPHEVHFACEHREISPVAITQAITQGLDRNLAFFATGLFRRFTHKSVENPSLYFYEPRVPYYQPGALYPRRERRGFTALADNRLRRSTCQYSV